MAENLLDMRARVCSLDSTQRADDSENLRAQAGELLNRAVAESGVSSQSLQHGAVRIHWNETLNKAMVDDYALGLHHPQKPPAWQIENVVNADTKAMQLSVTFNCSNGLKRIYDFRPPQF